MSGATGDDVVRQLIEDLVRNFNFYGGDLVVLERAKAWLAAWRADRAVVTVGWPPEHDRWTPATPARATMMASEDTLDLDYDENNDVLYASIGSRQPAVSHEISQDIWLDYLPPHRAVVRITILSFCRQYAIQDRTHVFVVAKRVVENLLHRYPSVPAHGGTPEVTSAGEENPYVQTFTSTTYGTALERRTIAMSVRPH